MRSGTESKYRPLGNMEQFEGWKLVELINHDPMKIVELDMGEQTHFYNCDFIEETLRQVPLLADVDRLIGIIKTSWMIDVDSRRQLVAKYDPQRRQWVAYVGDLPERLDEIRQRIARRRELEAQKMKLLEEWRVSHEPATPTQPVCIPAGVSNETEKPMYTDNGKENQTDSDNGGNCATATYHLDDLPKEVAKCVLLNDDAAYSQLVEDLRGPVAKWIANHRLQDWNVVKFTCMVHNIIALNTSVGTFAKLLMHVVPDVGDQENNMKCRTDANKKYVSCYETDSKLWKLKQDIKAIEECLANTIQTIKSQK